MKNKCLHFSLFFLFSLFGTLLNGQCISTPTGTVTSDLSGAPTACIFSPQVCVVIETAGTMRVEFELTSSDGTSFRGGENGAFTVGQTVCHTFNISLPCNEPNPSFSGVARGYDNMDGSAGAAPPCGTLTIPSFSELAPLPVDLVSFRAHLYQDQTIIEWVTASEENNDYFELQHSTNGQNFRTLETIQGFGTTSELQYYKYTHKQPQRGYNYYRIKQVDFDGSFEVFESVVVKVDAVKDIYNVYPSQVLDVVTLETPEVSTKNVDISIYNSTGLLVEQGILREGDYKISFNVSDLPAGIYFIRFINEDFDYTSKQFFIVRD